MAGTVHIRGLRELQRDLKKYASDVGRDLTKELKKAGEPVREGAERLAVGEISNIGTRWSQMRLGVTSRVVYVAPKAKRRRGSPRANLAPMLQRVMDTSLEEHRSEVIRDLEQMLDRLAVRNGF